MFQKQIDIYREYLKPFRFEEIMLNADGLIEGRKFSAVFDEPGEKFVDLTNGPKTTTALLYLAASLISIENIYFLSFFTGDSFRSAVSDATTFVEVTIIHSIRSFERKIKEKGGEIFFSGGDNILASVKDDYLNDIIQTVKEVNIHSTYSFSVGLGSTLKDVYLALKYSKSVSPGTIVKATADNGKVTFKFINPGE